MLDLTFDQESKKLLCGLIGHAMTQYRHDPFLYTSTFTRQGEIFFEDRVVMLKSQSVPVDFFFWGPDDVSKFSIQSIKKEEAVSALKGAKQIDFPVNETVIDVLLVEDDIKQKKDGKTVFEYCFAKGVIFVFKDRQIAFERQGEYFSEEIRPIKTNGNAISMFEPTKSGEDVWVEGQATEHSRNVTSLMGQVR
jgi:hypothetical protein